MNKLFYNGIFCASLVFSLNAQADIFDKMESAKDCVQNNNCNGHKWLKKAVAVKKCQDENNCVDKINEYAEKNPDKVRNVQDKITGGAEKVVSADKCLSTTNADEQAKCYESFKKHARERQAKKAEAAAAQQNLANQRKSLGDAVCLPGKIALGMVKVRIKGFVEQVSGNRIQIRIADTQGQSVNYRDVSLHQGSIIWDEYNNWISCSYLK